jgi:hypothetical protein
VAKGGKKSNGIAVDMELTAAGTVHDLHVIPFSSCSKRNFYSRTLNAGQIYAFFVTNKFCVLCLVLALFYS